MPRQRKNPPKLRQRRTPSSPPQNPPPQNPQPEPEPAQLQSPEPVAELSSPLPAELSEQNSGSKPSSDASHFDETPEPENQTGDIEGEVVEEPAPVVLSRETFVRNFIGLFNYGGRRGLSSLTVTPDEMAEAEEAFGALYDTALEVSWLNWLVQPGNIWVQRAAVFLPFMYGKSKALIIEVKEKRAAISHAAPGGTGDAIPEEAGPPPRDPETSVVVMG